MISVVRLLGPASGNLFPIGSTLVRHRAMDASGNTVRCQFYVTVVDDIFPTLSNCPQLSPWRPNRTNVGPM
ncbi:MAG: HYR domain-containing protein [Flavobacteriales bacterium]|nr:HYR domain-containing protein [Flavobacteriales bacterium]